MDLCQAKALIFRSSREDSNVRFEDGEEVDPSSA